MRCYSWMPTAGRTAENSVSTVHAQLSYARLWARQSANRLSMRQVTELQHEFIRAVWEFLGQDGHVDARLESELRDACVVTHSLICLIREHHGPSGTLFERLRLCVDAAEGLDVHEADAQLIRHLCNCYDMVIRLLRDNMDEEWNEADLIHASSINRYRFECEQQRFIQDAREFLHHVPDPHAPGAHVPNIQHVELRDAVVATNALLCEIFGDQPHVGGTLTQCLDICVARTLRLSTNERSVMLRAHDRVLLKLMEAWNTASLALHSAAEEAYVH